MPFQSKKQLKLCFALKRKNLNSTWDCEEWIASTKNIKSLPLYKDKKKNRSRSKSKSRSRSRSN